MLDSQCVSASDVFLGRACKTFTTEWLHICKLRQKGVNEALTERILNDVPFCSENEDQPRPDYDVIRAYKSFRNLQYIKELNIFTLKWFMMIVFQMHLQTIYKIVDDWQYSNSIFSLQEIMMLSCKECIEISKWMWKVVMKGVAEKFSNSHSSKSLHQSPCRKPTAYSEKLISCLQTCF